MITENLSTLKIHKLTRDQYNRELEAGNIDENALYLTPDETTDLSMYATKQDLNDKADKNHTHDNYATTDYVDGNFALKSEIGNIELSGYVKKSDLEIHNTNIEAHNDIRDLISGLSIKVTNFLDVDEDTTDQLSEVLTLINNNKGTLESLTTTKVNVSDIINNLTTNVSNKPLSAAQGVEIKRLIDILQDELDSLESVVDGKADENHGHSNATATTSGFMSADDKILLDKYRTDALGSLAGKTIPEIKAVFEDWISTVYNVPNVTATFSANIGNIVSYWNSGDNTSKVTAGATCTISLSTYSIYGDVKYSLLRITSYYDSHVWYVALTDGVWQPMRKTMFTNDIAEKASTILETVANPTDGRTYHIPFHAGVSTSYQSLYTNDGIKYYTREGTASAGGTAQLGLGNNIPTGTAGNKNGSIYLYGTSSGYTDIIPTNNTTSNSVIYLPSSSGTLALTKDFLPITGGNLTGSLTTTNGSIWASSSNAEVHVGVEYNGGNLYLYGNNSTGTRGIFDSKLGKSVISVTDSSASFLGNANSATYSGSIIRNDGNTTAKLSYLDAGKTSLGWGIRMTDANSKHSYLYLTANAENEAPWMRLIGADGNTYTDVLTKDNYYHWAAPEKHTHDNYTPYTELTDTTPTTAGWYRIAKTGAGIGNGSAVFQIVGVASGIHTTAIITASTSYGVTESTNINVLNCAHFYTAAFTKARIVYHTTYSGNYAYLEIYKPQGVAISTKVKMIASNDWALSTPSTAGSVPSGYLVKEVELKNNTLTGDLVGNALTATSADTASSLSNFGTLTTSETINNFITANKLQYALFQLQSDIGVGFASHDGMLLSIPWTSTNYGAQIAIDDSTTNPKIAIRAKNSSWGDWKILPFSDGTNASGTWDINITGSAGSATKSTWLDTNSSLTYGASGLNYFNINGTEGTDPASNATPTSAYYHILRMNHGNPSGYFADIATPLNDTNGVYWRQVRSGNNYGWYKFLDDHNYTDYVVPQTGGHFSGGLTTAGSIWVCPTENEGDVGVQYTGGSLYLHGNVSTGSRGIFDSKYGSVISVSDSSATFNGAANWSTSAGTLSGNQTTLSVGNESNAITIKNNSGGSIASQLGTTSSASLTNALDFQWYNTHWQIGSIRGGSTNTDGLGFTYSENGSTHTLVTKISPNGAVTATSFHGSFYGNVSGNATSADTLQGYAINNLYSSVPDWMNKVGLAHSIVVEGDKNTYYPVEIHLSSELSIPTRVSIYKYLGSQTPSIEGNHENGTSSMWLQYECRNGAWDGNGGYLKTLYHYMNYANLCAHTQLNTGANGNLIVWLRGGGCQYYISKTIEHTVPTIHYGEVNLGYGNYPLIVAPRTSIDNRGICTTTMLGYGSIAGSSTSCSGNSATASVANTLASGGNTSMPMTFHWSGQDGTPTWIFGGSSYSDIYVYNPANFSVNYANSAGYANSATNATYSSFLNLTAGNEIRIHNATGQTTGGDIWLGWAWASGDKTVNKSWIFGNFSGGGLADVTAKAFISDTWRSANYGGGWYMTDSTWIRNYNSKPVLINYAGQGGLTLDNGTVDTATGVRVRRTDLGYEARIGMSAAGNIGIWCTNHGGGVSGMIYKKPTDATDTVYIPDRVVMSGAYGKSAPPETGTLVKGMIYFQIVS